MDLYQIFRGPYTDEQTQVLEPIQHYFRGHADDDAGAMRQAFLPGAHIESMRDGSFTSWPLDQYCERFKLAPAADEKERERTVDWIDVQGSAACARITLRHGAMTFVDYFVLLQTEQGWKIANKVFHGRAADE